ncbi:MAG: hypothetical protein SCJ93_00635 [Bacillota bacterium]|nr:hypothetical protein [Bacillota bacterium]
MGEKQLSLFKLIKFNNKADTEMPENIHLEKNQLWCPYCSNKVVFKRDKRLGVKKCPICSITIHDYWVKKVNHLV